MRDPGPKKKAVSYICMSTVNRLLGPTDTYVLFSPVTICFLGYLVNETTLDSARQVPRQAPIT